MKHVAAIVTCVLGLSCVSHGITIEALSSEATSMEAMERVFFRSEEMHEKSMAAMMSSMSTAKAMHLLRKNNLSTPALLQVESLVKQKKTGLRTNPATGYAALDPAKNMLNEMIFNATSKYDVEIAMCTEFYTKQCARMEGLRGQISDANEICANSRALILYAQACIERAENDIIDEKQKLAFHLLQCKHELYKMRSRLKVLDGDLDVLTSVLKMTDCDHSFVQTDLQVLKCEDPCTHKHFYTFNQEALKGKMNQLQSSVSHDLIHESFNTLFDGIKGLQLLQAEDEYSPVVNKTRWNNPPVPRVKVPADPCTDPDQGAPSLQDKRRAKCTIKGPDCYKLQEKFLLIQSGVQDEHDELLDEIDMMENYCEETKKTLQLQIKNNQALEKDCQTKLAEATEKEATAAETGRVTAKEHDQADEELKHKMHTCSKHYIDYEGQICALKKIRAEIYKMKGAPTSASFFQDCVVSKWSPLDCSATCGGGTQLVQRTVMIHTNGGIECLPLQMEKTCNAQPCPIDCDLEAWTGWSKCSAQCGGGIEQRLREVKTAMRFDGRPCSATSQARSCNNQACEKDCELTDWTAWTTCSKDCDGGTMKREKYVKHAAEGAGKCANEWSIDRLEYKECNNHRCRPSNTTLMCDKSLDVVMLIDGSGSLGTTGWNAEITAAVAFIDAFVYTGAHSDGSHIAVILFSGPYTWGGVNKCIGSTTHGVDMVNDCKIRTVSHFTDNFGWLRTTVKQLVWPRGSTLTSVALLAAKTELSFGRKDSHAVVVVFTDGRPLSYRKTLLASREVRKAARLVWVPVTKYAPLKYIKKWATRRWQENVVVVDTFGELEKPDVVTHIIANICPKEQPKVEYEYIPGTQQPYR